MPVVHKNPVDGAAGAFLTRPFHDIAEAILKDDSVDALLAIFCEHKNWEYPSQGLVELANRFAKPIVACLSALSKKSGPIEPDFTRQGSPRTCCLKTLPSACEPCCGGCDSESCSNEG